VPVRRFAKGENKEAIARPLIDPAEREGGAGKVVLIGIAQEKTPVWRSWKAKGQEHLPHPHMEWGRHDGVRQPLLLLPSCFAVLLGVLPGPHVVATRR